MRANVPGQGVMRAGEETIRAGKETDILDQDV